MKILIVDDSKAMRMLVKRGLRAAGYGGHDTVEAANGQEALELVEKEGPDLVLSDWNMPVMSGLELLQALRAQENEVPFGFVTTEASEEMSTLARDAGATFLITKPFTSETMQLALEPTLG